MSGSVVTRHLVDSDGVVHVHKSQEVGGLMDALKGIPDVYDGKVAARKGLRFRASIPNVIALHWANEAGVTLYSKEWREVVMRKLQDSEFRHFNVDWRR